MDIRYTAGMILIAVGALFALLGGIAVVTPGPPDARPGIGFRLGCGGVGVVGVLMVLGGLRLRNRAVADSPALRRALEDRGPSSRTGTAKPRFLTRASDAAPPAPGAPKSEPVAPPAGPAQRAGSLVYWLVCLGFAAVVVGLMAAARDFFRGRDAARAAVLVVTFFVVLVWPAWALRSRRRF